MGSCVDRLIRCASTPRRRRTGSGRGSARCGERAGLTQEELAERAGLTPHAISALERGARTRPYPHTVRALAGALGLSEVEVEHFISAVPRRPTSSSTRGMDSNIVPSPQDGPEPGPGVRGAAHPPVRAGPGHRRSRGAGPIGNPSTHHAHRSWWGGQDPARCCPGRQARRRLLRRRRRRSAWLPWLRRWMCIGTIGRAMEIPGSDQGDVLAVITRHLGRAPGAADLGQLRAPDECGTDDQPARRQLPGTDDPGHQPLTPAGARRTRTAGRAARAAAPGRHLTGTARGVAGGCLRPRPSPRPVGAADPRPEPDPGAG